MLEVVQAPDPLLLENSQPCEFDDLSLPGLAHEMAQVMYATTGVGLAAVQVGIHKRLIVVDCDWDVDKYKPNIAFDKQGLEPLVLLNPSIIKASEEKEETSEGCLSCPGISAPVMRHKYVEVEYFDLQGQKHTIDAQGLFSHCLQHEIDHLEGKTLFQTCLPQHRITLIEDYRIAKQNGAVPGEVS